METKDYFITIEIPDLKIQKTIETPKNVLIWDLKKIIISEHKSVLLEWFNYAFYCPSKNGQSEKFLEDERKLSDYRESDTRHLQLIHMRRIFKNESYLKFLKKRPVEYQKKLLQNVKMGDILNISKMLLQGTDPNFQLVESGETAMVAAAKKKPCRDLIVALFEGGALLNYRDRDGYTPLHVASMQCNYEAIKALLDLGASPNCRTLDGLTPLYLLVCSKGSFNKETSDNNLTSLKANIQSPLKISTDLKTLENKLMCCVALLREFSMLDCSDENGWTELHQACKLNQEKMAKKLIEYGATVNAQNMIGNTPLHIAVLNNKKNMVQLLLEEGADVALTNDANHDALYCATMTNAIDIFHLLTNYNNTQTVKLRHHPSYNNKRVVVGDRKSLYAGHKSFTVVNETPHIVPFHHGYVSNIHSPRSPSLLKPFDDLDERKVKSSSDIYLLGDSIARNEDTINHTKKKEFIPLNISDGLASIRAYPKRVSAYIPSDNSLFTRSIEIDDQSTFNNLEYSSSQPDLLTADNSYNSENKPRDLYFKKKAPIVTEECSKSSDDISKTNQTLANRLKYKKSANSKSLGRVFSKKWHLSTFLSEAKPMTALDDNLNYLKNRDENIGDINDLTLQQSNVFNLNKNKKFKFNNNVELRIKLPNHNNDERFSKALSYFEQVPISSKNIEQNASDKDFVSKAKIVLEHYKSGENISVDNCDTNSQKNNSYIYDVPKNILNKSVIKNKPEKQEQLVNEIEDILIEMENMELTEYIISPPPLFK